MNTTIVQFIGHDTMAFAKPLWQWDYGQILVIRGVLLPASFEVHWTDKATGTTTTTLGQTAGGVSSVTVPDIYLESGNDVFAYIYLHETNADGETEYKITIPVLKRPQPTHETPTPVQQTEIEQIIAELGRETDAAAQSASDAADSAREAAQSASDASDYARAAAQSETNAGHSEDNAAASERNAASSADNSARSAAAAAESARLAGLSETAAAGSARDADDAKRDAITARQNAQAAQAAAETAQGKAKDAEDAAEAWATGGESGTPSETNNAKYYSEQASGSATDAAAAKIGAETAEDNAEAWATGGSSGTPSATNNAKYYADQAGDSAAAASGSASAADDSAEDSEAWAVGQRDGADVPDTDPAYHNNSKYYAEQAAGIAPELNQRILASFSTNTISNQTVASFSDGADGIPVKELKITITPVQSGSGDPSPTNVRPISGWNGANIVVSPTLDAADGTTYPVSWETKAGTVCGGTLRDNGDGTWTLTVTHGRAQVKDFGWTRAQVSGASFYRFWVYLDGKATGLGNIICEALQTSDAEVVADMTDNRIRGASASNTVSIRADTFSTVEELKDTTTGIGNAAIVYELATPMTYTLTAESVKTLLGDNNIFADTGDVLKLVYRVDPQAEFSSKQDVLTFDNAPTDGSDNPVKSNGIYYALALKAPLDSPTLTGTPTSPTPTAGDDSTKIATTAFVKNAVDAVAVQSDWNENDTDSLAFIKNKPTIPAAQVNADWDAVSGAAQILNKPTIPAAQVNSDWNASSGVAEILNKPTIPSTHETWTFTLTDGTTVTKDVVLWQ